MKNLISILVFIFIALACSGQANLDYTKVDSGFVVKLRSDGEVIHQFLKDTVRSDSSIYKVEAVLFPGGELFDGGATSESLDSIAAHRAELDLKAEKSELTDSVTYLESLIDLKADQTDFEDSLSDLRTNLSTKQQLTDSVTYLESLIDLKADQSAFEDSLSDLRTDLATKQQLTDSVTYLEGLISVKAYQSALEDTALAIRTYSDGKFSTQSDFEDSLASHRTDLATKLALQDTALNIRNDLPNDSTYDILEAGRIDYYTNQSALPWKEGRRYYDNVKKNWVSYNNRSNTALDDGREGRLRGVNNTGSTITNGKVVIIDGDSDGIRTIALANALYDSTAIGTIGFTTEDIAPGDTGEVTIWGEINNVDNSTCTSGDLIWLDTIDGGFRNTLPESPAWEILLGNCGKVDASTGSINVKVDIRTNTSDVLGIFNGAILESHTISILNNGTTVRLKLMSEGRNTLTLFFDDIPYRFNVPDSIVLNTGSDQIPTRNWVYIPKSTKQLTVSTTSFPANEQYVPIADILLQSAASALNDGVYKVHAWTDHIQGSSGQGHLSHVNSWIRKQDATWISGVVPSLTVGTNAAGLDTLKYSNTSGVVLQLHQHDYPAVDLINGGHTHVVNDQSTSYLRINNLSAISTTTEGDNLRLNNTFYSLVIWGSVSEDSADCQIFVNKPSGSYGSQEAVEGDANQYTVYTIPAEYRGTGFLIAKYNIRYQVTNGGTLAVVSSEDLRGLFPATGAGGGSIATSSGEFSDNTFTIYNINDNTKEIDFDASGITTGNARTIIMADTDVNLADIALKANQSALEDTASSIRGELLTNLSTEGQLLYNNGGAIDGNDTYKITDGVMTFTAPLDTALKISAGRGIFIDSSSFGMRIFNHGSYGIFISNESIAASSALKLFNNDNCSEPAFEIEGSLLNTGALLDIRRSSNEKLIIDSDGEATFYDTTHFDKPVLFNDDVEMNDSTYLNYLIDAEGDEQWLLLTSTGAIGADSLINAGEGLTDPIIDFETWLEDTVNGEGAWKSPTGNFEHTITTGRPSEAIFKLQYMIEMLIRNQVELHKRIEELEGKLNE